MHKWSGEDHPRPWGEHCDRCGSVYISQVVWGGPSMSLGGPSVIDMDGPRGTICVCTSGLGGTIHVYTDGIL